MAYASYTVVLRFPYHGSTIGKVVGRGTPLPDGDRGGDALAASDWLVVGRRLQAGLGKLEGGCE